MADLTGGIWKNTVAAIYKPSAFVQAREDFSHGLWSKAVTASGLTFFYILNLVLYVGPLTLSIHGTERAYETQEWFQNIGELLYNVLLAGGLIVGGDEEAAINFFFILWDNTFSMFLASVFVFIGFHGAIILTRSNNGILQSIHTVVNSTGIYLAGLFTLVVTLSGNESTQIAAAVIRDLQLRYINFWLELFAGNPETAETYKQQFPGEIQNPDLSQMTGADQFAMFVFFLIVIYFAYSIYLGARVNHETGRIDSLLTFVFMALLPGGYVFGLIIWNTMVLGVGTGETQFGALVTWHAFSLRAVESGVLTNLPMLIGG